MRTEISKSASGMPLMAIYNKQNMNRELIALSDAANPTKLQAGVVEENANVRFKIDLFDAICPHSKGGSRACKGDLAQITKGVAEIRNAFCDEGGGRQEETM